MVFSNYIEEIIVTAVSYHLMNNKDLSYRNGKLVISSKSLSHGLSIFQEGKDSLKMEENDDSAKIDEVPPDNDFEKPIRPEVIPASEIGVAFDDIGATILRSLCRSLLCFHCEDQISSVEFLSPVGEYYSLGHLVLGRQCWQRL